MARFLALLFYFISFCYVPVGASDINEAVRGEANANAAHLPQHGSSTMSISIGKNDDLHKLTGKSGPLVFPMGRVPESEAEGAQTNSRGTTLQGPTEGKEGVDPARPAFSAQQQGAQRKKLSRCKRFWRFICCCCCCCCRK